MDPKEIAAIDQATKMLADTVPPMLHSFYKACVKEGFTPDQAMQIILKYFEKLGV